MARPVRVTKTAAAEPNSGITTCLCLWWTWTQETGVPWALLHWFYPAPSHYREGYLIIVSRSSSVCVLVHCHPEQCPLQSSSLLHLY